MKIYKITTILLNEPSHPDNITETHLKTPELVAGLVAATLVSISNTKIIIEEIEMTQEELDKKHQETFEKLMEMFTDLDNKIRQN